MSKIVLDASALIAYIKGEPSAENLGDLLPNAFISTVNYAEVTTVLSNLNMPIEIIESTLDDLIGEVIPFTQRHALLTAELRSLTKIKGLSLGDRACIALGIAMNLPIYTADKVWGQLQLEGVDIKLIR